jgi:hypothetical protein
VRVLPTNRLEFGSRIEGTLANYEKHVNAPGQYLRQDSIDSKSQPPSNLFRGVRRMQIPRGDATQLQGLRGPHKLTLM